MIRAGLVVMVVVSVALLMTVMTADWLHAWLCPIGRSRDWTEGIVVRGCRRPSGRRMMGRHEAEG